MGWLWSSSSDGEGTKAENVVDVPSGRSLNLTEEQRQRIFGKSGLLQDSDRSRDEKADKDLEAFLNSLSNDDSNKTDPNPTSSPKSPTQTIPAAHTNHDRILPDGTLNISRMALYPRTMSCRQAFDQAFYCQSLGGKFNDIYRFGAIQSCSEQWGAFWFCMRTKSLPKEEKEKQIRDYYAAREARKEKVFGSSENVWDIREKPVESAFQEDPGPL